MGNKKSKSALYRKICAWILTFTMVAGMIGIPVTTNAAESTQKIAAWEVSAMPDNALTEADPLAATAGSGSLYVSGAEKGVWSKYGIGTTKWTENAAWMIANINATGYTGLTFSAKLRSSNTGARDFVLEYSLDNGASWTGVADSSIQVGNNANGGYDQLSLSMLDGKAFALRIRMSSTTSVKGDGNTVADAGVSNINNIIIEGVGNADSGNNGSETTTTCEKVTASVESGEVAKGTKVTLSCATEGATIMYSVNDGESVEYTEAIVVDEDTTIKAYAVKNGAANSAVSTFTYTVKAEDNNSGSDTSKSGECLNSLKNGDTFIVYNPANKVAMTATASGTKLTGVSAEPSDSDTLVSDDAAVLTAEQDKDGNYTFTCDGKYLTSGATGNSLTFEDAASDYSLWTLEAADDNGGYFIKNVNAQYSGNAQYMEYYKTFTMYGKGATAKPAAYLMNFYRAEVSSSSDIEIDTDKVYTIAQWAGNANYEEANVDTAVKGDLYKTNDMLDTDAEYSAVVSGTKVLPYIKATSSNTGSTSYYMGATGLGSGTDDYAQFKLSSQGYGAMQLSFRMRATKSAPGTLQLQYSTDGKEFKNFTTGTYSYKYTTYNSSGESSEVTGDGKITDGVAQTSKAPTYYINYTFDVPQGADNAQTLYIRLVPGETRANGTASKADKGGTIRIDSLVLEGSPVKAADLCGYVTVSPEAGEIAANSEVTLTSATKGAEIYYSLNNGEYKLYDADKKPVIESLPATIRVYAKKDGLKDSIKTVVKYTAGKVKSVTATPKNGGAVVKDTEIELKCATEDAEIYYSTDQKEWTKYTEKIKLSTLPVTYYVKAVKDGYEDSSISTLAFTERTSDKYSLYFGQLHAHTNYSDGAGSCEDAYQHATGVDNLDFLAVTDHSNSFDNANDASILDGSVSSEWNEGNELADKYTTKDFVSIFGYEMTWSNGLGHMNTFNTNGFQSRTQTEYATYSTALQNYYATLKKVPDSISQFNHPGTTFGDFSDFSYYDEELDTLITMIEVGNGEGAIGSSGYFPSYQYYQRALDKGWHVAPTNNQDNHKGLWGDANTARSVVMVDSLTRDNIYDALRNYRMYATEDNDLSIYYTLDDYEMGSILTEGQTGDKVTLKAELKDPTDAKIGKVQVITNGGLVLAETQVDSNEDTVTFEVDNNYSYYYLKVTEADGDIAVTAPVWVGDVEAAGINSISTTEVLPVQGQALDVNLELYNNENTDMTINSIEFKVGDEVVHTADLTKISKVESMGTAAYSFDFTYDGVGSIEVEAVVNATLNGASKVYNSTLKLNYVTPQMVTKVVIDGSHYNDYVTGYYGGNVSNFAAIAGKKNIRVETLTDESKAADALADCSLFIVSAPAKKDGTANAGDYKISHFSDDFLKAVKDYTDKGGTIIVCGTADYQDTVNGQSSTEINKLLGVIGATTQIYSDEAYDEENNGGQNYRLYLTNYNTESKYLDGAVEGQKYSAYSGCTVKLDPDAVAAGKAEALINGFDTTYSIDTKDENGNKVSGSPVVVEKGNVVALGHETLSTGANVFVAGTVFVSDFEVKAEMDNQFDLQYLNYTIINNILDEVTVELEVTPIAEVRKAEMGEVFAIEGYATAARANKDNAFFDAICVQDDTAGITVFPFADDTLELGTKVRIIGYVDAYQGEKELQVISSKVLSDEEKNVYAPKQVSAKDAMDYDLNGGNLVQVTGKVVKITDKGTNGDTSVNQFYIDDGSGTLANIFIDGYIKSGTTGTNEIGTFVKEGAYVSAVGLVYSHPATGSDDNEIVLRVRNCDEIVLADAGSEVVKDELASLVTAGSDLDESKYTVESYKAMLRALANAKAVLENPDSTQEEIDAAKEALDAAIKALVADNSNPGTGDGNGNGSGNGTGTGNGNGSGTGNGAGTGNTSGGNITTGSTTGSGTTTSTKTASKGTKTGDTNTALLYLFIAAAGASMAVAAAKRKKRY